jgi:hypothetical protein
MKLFGEIFDTFYSKVQFLKVKFILSAVFFGAFTIQLHAKAELGNSPSNEQVRSDARQFMNRVHRAQMLHYDEWAEYSDEMDKISVSLPTHIKGYFSVSLTVTPVTKSGYQLKLMGIASPVKGDVFSIDNSGSFQGMTQFENATDLTTEIQSLLQNAWSSEKAYYAEYSSYSSDFSLAGFFIPSYMKNYGIFSAHLTEKGFVVEFLGNHFPLMNMKFSIDEKHKLVVPQ